MSSYQGGPFVDIFVGQGRNPTAEWKITPPSSVQRVYDKPMKGFVFVLAGSSGSTSKMALPSDEKKSLGLVQNFLVLQIFIPHGQSFALELGITDTSGSKRRVHLSTSFKELAPTPLHARVPLLPLPRNVWMNLVIDLHDLVTHTFKGQTFRTLDSILLRPNCTIRRIFTLRSSPYEDSEANTSSRYYGKEEPLPKTHDFPLDIPTLTQIFTMEKSSAYCSSHKDDMMESQKEETSPSISSPKGKTSTGVVGKKILSNPLSHSPAPKMSDPKSLISQQSVLGGRIVSAPLQRPPPSTSKLRAKSALDNANKIPTPSISRTPLTSSSPSSITTTTTTTPHHITETAPKHTIPTQNPSSQSRRTPTTSKNTLPPQQQQHQQYNTNIITPSNPWESNKDSIQHETSTSTPTTKDSSRTKRSTSLKESNVNFILPPQNSPPTQRTSSSSPEPPHKDSFGDHEVRYADEIDENGDYIKHENSDSENEDIKRRLRNRSGSFESSYSFPSHTSRASSRYSEHPMESVDSDDSIQMENNPLHEVSFNVTRDSSDIEEEVKRVLKSGNITNHDNNNNNTKQQSTNFDSRDKAKLSVRSSDDSLRISDRTSYTNVSTVFEKDNKLRLGRLSHLEDQELAPLKSSGRNSRNQTPHSLSSFSSSTALPSPNSRANTSMALMKQDWRKSGKDSTQGSSSSSVSMSSTRDNDDNDEVTFDDDNLKRDDVENGLYDQDEEDIEDDYDQNDRSYRDSMVHSKQNYDEQEEYESGGEEENSMNESFEYPPQNDDVESSFEVYHNHTENKNTNRDSNEEGEEEEYEDSDS